MMGLIKFKIFGMVWIGCLLVVISNFETKAQQNPMKMQVGYVASNETIYKMTEHPPAPCGGLSAFYEYTEDTIKRPEEAKKKGIKGNVFVRFIVEKDGKLSNIEVIKGIGGGCDEEVVKCLKNAPRWTPGKHNGVAVRVQKTMSIQVR